MHTIHTTTEIQSTWELFIKTRKRRRKKKVVRNLKTKRHTVIVEIDFTAANSTGTQIMEDFCSF